MYKVYTKPDCPFCYKAKALLEKMKLPYAEIVIGVDVTREEFIELYPTARTVPVIVENAEFIGGYTQLVEHLTPKTQLLNG